MTSPYTVPYWKPGLSRWYIRLIMGWTVWKSNSAEGKMFCTHFDQPWGPPNLINNGYQLILSCKAVRGWC
jgi:hypothetical protein